MKNKEIKTYLSELNPNPKCPLNYTLDYELLIAVVLSAQSHDDQVNNVTKVLFEKYNLETLSKANLEDIVDIIRPAGNMHKKAKYIIEICNRLIKEQNGKVPNDREYLESLPGVGRKTTNVILATLFDEPAFAVDTHIERVAKRLGIADDKDNILEVEEKLMKFYKKEEIGKAHLQVLLFGRYICKAKNPLCETCKLKKYCSYSKHI